MDGFSALLAMRDALSGLKTVLDIAKKTLPNEQEHKRDIIKLYKALKIAVSETRVFIEANNGKHVRNLQLQKLWLEAFECAQRPYLVRDKSFPLWLDSKADFWANPQSWLKEESCMEMVPTLKAIEKKIDELKGDLKL